MTNLLQETKNVIKDNGLEIKDIIFIGSLRSGHTCSWKQFRRLADVEYNSGFGAQRIASDLVIVFQSTTLMERVEYDGSEGWKVNQPVELPSPRKPISSLIIDNIGWKTLQEMNEK